MQNFKEYIKMRESSFSQDDDKPLNPTANNEDNVLSNIINIAWKKHTSRTKQFFRKLAAIDPEIGSQFEQLDDSENSEMDRNPFKEKDVIRTPESDSGSSSEDDN